MTCVSNPFSVLYRPSSLALILSQTRVFFEVISPISHDFFQIGVENIGQVIGMDCGVT